MSYWILKTEPGAYSFENLVRDKKTVWDGVRNYQARNNLRLIKKNDICFIYHSVGPKELVGSAKVVKEAYQDPSTSDERWVVVEIKPLKAFAKAIKLAQLKEHPVLSEMQLVKQSRLSVCPLNKKQGQIILSLSEA
ncbi:EVE domain-containing protein [Sulfobacillus acidophilus]|uniref:EVE domain-containing protein n=1 Tax=Sulfobacillus acidophilus TaxID=53633 RepID=A0ABS3AWI5_9FIRM|nr:EVE domain-containing protein [Sulfobacillus acidophilus]